MKNSINRITIINIISTFILQGITFFTTPLFTRILGTTQFGLYSLYYSWVLITGCVMGLNVQSSIGVAVIDYKNTYINYRNSILVSGGIIALVQVGIILLFRSGITGLVGLNTQIIVLIAISSFGKFLIDFAQITFIYERKPVCNLLLSTAVGALSVIISLLLIYFSANDTRYVARILGSSVVYLILGIVAFFILYREAYSKPNKRHLQYALVISLPVVFHCLSQNILGQSDRVMMQLFNCPTTDLGIYSLFYMFVSALNIILNALNNSWCPFYYDDIDKKKWDVLNIKCKNYVELFSVLGVGFLLLSREVSYIMADNSYWRGINIIPILVFAVYFTFMYQFPVNFEFFHKKTKIIAVGTVGAGILNILLNACMIPKWGMYGAAIATALSYLALFFVHYIIANRINEHSYHLKMIVFVPGLVSMIIGLILFYVLAPWWYVRWGLGLALGSVECYRIYKRKSIF